MTKNAPIQRLETGVPNLDAIFHGGLPTGSVTVLAGPPGSGKTILTEQICFHNATKDRRVLYFSTLSEPSAKTLRYLSQLSFFDAGKLKDAIQFIDLGEILRASGLPEASTLVMDHVKRVKPAIVVIDSFKVFDDLAKSNEELRKFGYDLAVKLMAWETTVLLLGEYGPDEYEHNPLFSIVDGLLVLTQRQMWGEHQRFLRIVKLRGTSHSHDEHSFLINDGGVELFAPRAVIHRVADKDKRVERCQTHIPKLDELLGPGIPWGSSLLVSGVAGTGKTVLSLEFLYRGAVAGEKGILFSFEETDERLRATARGLGFDIDKEIERGMIEIVFIPQPEIMVESQILMMRDRIDAVKAKRVVIDSVSVFLHKLDDPQQRRERIFHLCTIIQNAGAVGFFPTDIPYGSTQISRYGVEETVVDGVLILTSTEEGFERQRYLEVYKLRNTAHLKGRHNMLIEGGGVTIFPRYDIEENDGVPAPSVELDHRLASGVPGLDSLMGGGLLKRSLTLVSGSAGIGKSTLATQFILGGIAQNERGLYVALEEGPDQLMTSADALDVPLRKAVKDGLVEILYVVGEELRAGELLSALSDKITALKAQRLVLDAATYMMTQRMSAEDLHHVLSRLAVRFKTLGVTSLIALESSALTEREHVTERALSPIADNLLMLRYRDANERLAPTLTVVKTRGSSHDRTAHGFTITSGGMRIDGATHHPSHDGDRPKQMPGRRNK